MATRVKVGEVARKLVVCQRPLVSVVRKASLVLVGLIVTEVTRSWVLILLQWAPRSVVR